MGIETIATIATVVGGVASAANSLAGAFGGKPKQPQITDPAVQAAADQREARLRAQQGVLGLTVVRDATGAPGIAGVGPSQGLRLTGGTA